MQVKDVLELIAVETAMANGRACVECVGGLGGGGGCM